MEPTFYSGDYIFISKQAYRLFGEPERGDVIVFRTDMKDENNKDKNLIKRIIGLPGDTVEIIGGYVYLNGKLIDEPYLNEQGETVKPAEPNAVKLESFIFDALPLADGETVYDLLLQAARQYGLLLDCRGTAGGVHIVFQGRGRRFCPGAEIY